MLAPTELFVRLALTGVFMLNTLHQQTLDFTLVFKFFLFLSNKMFLTKVFVISTCWPIAAP